MFDQPAALNAPYESRSARHKFGIVVLLRKTLFLIQKAAPVGSAQNILCVLSKCNSYELLCKRAAR